MKTLSVDVETASIDDLRKTGASRYSRGASTMVTVVAWAFGDEPVKSQTLPKSMPQEILEHIKAGGIVQAWNADFERNIFENVWGVKTDPAQWSCTMQRAMHAGLPASLGEAGPALGLDIVKDRSAHALMLRMCKPRSIDPLRWWHDEDAEKLEALRQYCVRDVEAEREIAKNIPDLPIDEQLVSILDRRANALGVRIDRRAVLRMQKVAEEATKALNAECASITAGAVKSPGTNPASVLRWLGDFAPEDLGKQSVAEALKRNDLPDDVRRVLEIRQEVAKSSTKKLNAMLATMDEDNRIRGALQYYGASRTGRWSGRFVQPQNFPRGKIKRPNEAIEFMNRGAGADLVEAFYGNPLDVVASCLRGMIIPHDGNAFVVSDASQIEARVVAWLAGQQDILDVFAKGEDVYTYTAKKNGSSDRQFGKVLVLACGFGMGASKFKDTALTYGIDMSEEEAASAVSGWRDNNAKIRSLWYRIDDAAKEAIAAADKKRIVTTKANDRLSITVSRARNGSKLMTMLLPSGRRLFYRDASLERIDGRDAITFRGVDQKTKRWTKLRTYGGKLIENATQATARDIVAQQALTIDEENLGRLVLSVHDELVEEVSVDTAQHALREITRIMSTAPVWADGLPCACEAHVMHRYGK